MDPATAKLIGAGLACTGLIGAGIGVGTISATTLVGRCAISPPPITRIWMFVGAAKPNCLLAFARNDHPAVAASGRALSPCRPA
jgi:hypothetical protein